MVKKRPNMEDFCERIGHGNDHSYEATKRRAKLFRRPLAERKVHRSLEAKGNMDDAAGLRSLKAKGHIDDTLELEDELELQFRLKMFNLGPNVGAGTFKKSSAYSLCSSSVGDAYSKGPVLSDHKIDMEKLKKFVASDQFSRLRNRPKPTLETVVKMQIQEVLDFFRDNVKGGDYEFVKLESMLQPSFFVTHTNFFARLKGTSSIPEFFFAEMENCPLKVTHCCKLENRLNYDSGSGTRDGSVYHCDHIKCQDCVPFTIRPNEFYTM